MDEAARREARRQRILNKGKDRLEQISASLYKQLPDDEEHAVEPEEKTTTTAPEETMTTTTTMEQPQHKPQSPRNESAPSPQPPRFLGTTDSHPATHEDDNTADKQQQQQHDQTTEPQPWFTFRTVHSIVMTATALYFASWAAQLNETQWNPMGLCLRAAETRRVIFGMEDPSLLAGDLPMPLMQGFMLAEMMLQSAKMVLKKQEARKMDNLGPIADAKSMGRFGSIAADVYEDFCLFLFTFIMVLVLLAVGGMHYCPESQPAETSQ